MIKDSPSKYSNLFANKQLSFNSKSAGKGERLDERCHRRQEARPQICPACPGQHVGLAAPDRHGLGKEQVEFALTPRERLLDGLQTTQRNVTPTDELVLGDGLRQNRPAHLLVRM
jgi:hypothetical protein